MVINNKNNIFDINSVNEHFSLCNCKNKKCFIDQNILKIYLSLCSKIEEDSKRIKKVQSSNSKKNKKGKDGKNLKLSREKLRIIEQLMTWQLLKGHAYDKKLNDSQPTGKQINYEQLFETELIKKKINYEKMITKQKKDNISVKRNDDSISGSMSDQIIPDQKLQEHKFNDDEKNDKERNDSECSPINERLPYVERSPDSYQKIGSIKTYASYSYSDSNNTNNSYSDSDNTNNSYSKSDNTNNMTNSAFNYDDNEFYKIASSVGEQVFKDESNIKNISRKTSKQMNLPEINYYDHVIKIMNDKKIKTEQGIDLIKKNIIELKTGSEPEGIELRKLQLLEIMRTDGKKDLDNMIKILRN